MLGPLRFHTVSISDLRTATSGTSATVMRDCELDKSLQPGSGNGLVGAEFALGIESFQIGKEGLGGRFVKQVDMNEHRHLVKHAPSRVHPNTGVGRTPLVNRIPCGIASTTEQGEFQ
jgi:hypothetical protein